MQGLAIAAIEGAHSAIAARMPETETGIATAYSATASHGDAQAFSGQSTRNTRPAGRPHSNLSRGLANVNQAEQASAAEPGEDSYRMAKRSQAAARSMRRDQHTKQPTTAAQRH